MFSDLIRKYSAVVDSVGFAQCVAAVVFLKFSKTAHDSRGCGFSHNRSALKLRNLLDHPREELWPLLLNELKILEQHNPFELHGLFDPLPLLDAQPSFFESKTLLLREIILAVDSSDLDERELLSQAFLQSNPPSVETPQTVAELISALVDCKDGESVFDPVCGNANLLLTCAAADAQIAGIEKNTFIWTFAKINSILNNYISAKIINDDCFSKKIDRTKRYDIVVAHPPWGLRVPAWSTDMIDLQIPYYAENPKALMDYAFISEVIRRMEKSTGRAAVLVSNGILTRSGPESIIRREIVTNRFIEAVIALPDKTFLNTAVSASIILLSSKRIFNDIFFVDARPYATSGRIQNTFSKNAIEEISLIVKERRTITGKSRVVALDEIAAQDYTINAPRYVGSAEHTDPIEVISFTERKFELNKEINELTSSIEILLSTIKGVTNR